MKRLIHMTAIAVTALFCFMTAVHAADSYFELNGFAFDINSDGKATIHDYSGSDTDVVIPASLLKAPVITIGNYAFYGKAITSVSFDSAAQLETIGEYAFCNCSSLNDLSIPSGVGLSFGSFQNCASLGKLSIDEGIGEIPEQCFYSCSSLSEINLPESVTVIGTRAFGECSSIRYLYLSDAVTAIAPKAFEGSADLIIRCEYDSYAAQYAKDNDIPAEYPYHFLLGDVDGDEDISTLDVTMIQRVIANLCEDSDGLFTLRGCVSGEEPLSIIDATLIQRYLAHLATPCPIGGESTGYTSAESVFA